MQDTLEDWQLALLVEARRHDDPVVVEAAEAEQLREAQDLLAQSENVDNPVVVEHDAYKQFEEAEELLSAAQGIEDWKVVSEAEWEANQEATDAVTDLLSTALKEHHGLKDSVVEAMGAPEMVEQFRDEDDDGDGPGDIKLESLSQQPETGGGDGSGGEPQGAGGAGDGDGDGEGGPGDVESLEAEQRQEVSDKLTMADRMENRTPDYAETLRQEAADIVGVDDPADIDMEAL